MAGSTLPTVVFQSSSKPGHRKCSSRAIFLTMDYSASPEALLGRCGSARSVPYIRYWIQRDISNARQVRAAFADDRLKGEPSVVTTIRGVTFEENHNNSMGLQFYNLSHRFGYQSPNWPYFEDVKIERIHYHAKSGVLSQRITTSMHNTTHID